MENKQQSAIDWLVEQVNSDCLNSAFITPDLYEKAKKMEEWKTIKDPIVQQVVDKFQERSERGYKKYGTTLHENNADDYLTHLQEELMDAILYIQKLKDGTSVSRISDI